MQQHTHVCHFCPRSETVEAERPRTTLPEGWHWMTRRKEKEANAVAVCPPCWKREQPEIAMSRAKGNRSGRPRAGGCCG